MTKPAALERNDYLNDDGLARVEELVARVPQDIEIGLTQLYPSTIVATLQFPAVKSPGDRVDDLPNILHAAMCVDALCRNLRAERAGRDAVLQLHRPAGPATRGEHKGKMYCPTCSVSVDAYTAFVVWPCRTAQALGAEEGAFE